MWSALCLWLQSAHAPNIHVAGTLAEEVNKIMTEFNLGELTPGQTPIAEYERNLKLHEDVIRFITIKIKDYDGKPSVIFQHSNESNRE